MTKTARVVAVTDIPHFRPLIARDLVKLYKAFTERFPNPHARADALTVEAFHALFDDCQTEYLHFIGRTSATQPYVRFLVEEVLSLACIYLTLPTLLPTTRSAGTTQAAGATLKAHVQPFGFLLVYMLYATQPLHAPPQALSVAASTSSPVAPLPDGPAARAARRRREETGVADLTVLEFALRCEEQEEQASAASAASVEEKASEAETWEAQALDDADLFPHLYPLPLTLARPVMDFYLSGVRGSSASAALSLESAAAPVQLLPVERYVLAALHHHKAWNIVPVVDLAAPLAAITKAHADLEVPLMSLPMTRRTNLRGLGAAGGRGWAAAPTHALFGARTHASQRLSTSLSQSALPMEAPRTGLPSDTDKSLMHSPAFQAQLAAYRALKEQVSGSEPQ